MAGPRARRSPCRNPPPAGNDELAGEAPNKAAGPASNDELFKQFIKTYLEAQAQAAPSQSEPRERLLKARFPDPYFGKSHMDCYHFCQQCEDHFDIAQATGLNRIPFAASLLRGNISFRWAQYKRRHKEAAAITWSEFKAFLQKNLGGSRLFLIASGVNSGAVHSTS